MTTEENHQTNGVRAGPTTGAGDPRRALITGDISPLSTAERLTYYKSVCDSVGRAPSTCPFDYLTLNGKMILYAQRMPPSNSARSTTSTRIVARERLDDVYVVTTQAAMPDGRCDESIGAVSIAGLKGKISPTPS